MPCSPVAGDEATTIHDVPLSPAADVKTMIACLAPRVRVEYRPICFDGETGWMILGDRREIGITSVQLAGKMTEVDLVCALYRSRQFSNHALPLVRPTQEEIERKTRQVKELACSSVVEGVEWWQLEGAGSGVCAAVLRLCSGCEFVAVAPLTSDLPREAFLAVTQAWFDHHPEYAKAAGR